MIELLSTMTRYRMPISVGSSREEPSVRVRHRARVELMQKAVLLLTLATSLLGGLINLPLIACFALSGTSIAASLIGFWSLAAYHWPANRDGR